MTADDTNPYLQTEILQLWVKANLRAWSAGMAKKREAEADALARRGPAIDHRTQAADQDGAGHATVLKANNQRLSTTLLF